MKQKKTASKDAVFFVSMQNAKCKMQNFDSPRHCEPVRTLVRQSVLSTFMGMRIPTPAYAGSE